MLQVLAVGAGSTLRVDWTGSTLNETGALLDGGKAVTTAAASYTGTASFSTWSSPVQAKLPPSTVVPATTC